MAMIDYGAVVKKNGKLLPHKSLFNNYSTLSGGVLDDEQMDYIGDESIRKDIDGADKSVIHNYMAVIGDKKFLIATYKTFIAIFDDKKKIFSHWLGEYDQGGWHIHYKIVEKLETPFGSIKIKRFPVLNDRAIASFWYKNDYYEILFGYGVDRKEFIFSKSAKRYFDAKTLRKVRRWFLNVTKE